MFNLRKIITITGIVCLEVMAFTASARANTDLKVAVIPAEVSGQAFYGADMGFFSKAGLNVDIQVMNGGAIANAIVSGSIDVGLVDAVSLITAHAKGLPIVCIAPGASSTVAAPVFGIAYKSDAPLRDGKDFNGLTVGVSGLNNIAALPTRAWIDQNGGDSKSIKFVEIPYPVLVPSLGRGIINVALLTEPWITAATDANYSILYPVKNGIAPAFLASCWATTKEWSEKNAATARAFTSQALASSRWANANPAASAPILAKYLNVPVANVLRSHRYTFAESIDPATLQPLIQTAVKYGVIQKSFPAGDVLIGSK